MKKPKVSQVLFGIVGVIGLIFGVSYILWPIAPYHTEIIGMSYEKLSANYSNFSRFITTLVDVAGLAFITMGGLSLHIGRDAWRERKSWLSILIIFVAMLLPLTFIVYSIGGPTLAMVLVAALSAGGLISSHFEEV